MSTTPQPEPVVVNLFAEVREFEEEITIPRAEWDAMTPAQRGEAIRSALDQALSDNGGFGWSVASGATDAEVD